MTDLSDFIRREHEPMVRDLRGQITRANVALRDLREQLETARAFIEHMGMSYRYEEWVGEQGQQVPDRILGVDLTDSNPAMRQNNESRPEGRPS